MCNVQLFFSCLALPTTSPLTPTSRTLTHFTRTLSIYSCQTVSPSLAGPTLRYTALEPPRCARRHGLTRPAKRLQHRELRRPRPTATRPLQNKQHHTRASKPRPPRCCVRVLRTYPFSCRHRTLFSELGRGRLRDWRAELDALALLNEGRLLRHASNKVGRADRNGIPREGQGPVGRVPRE